MTKMGVIGGLITGALVGSAITMLVDPISDKQKRKMKKSGTHMFKTVGTMLDTMMVLKK